MSLDDILDEKTNKLFLQKVRIDIDNANNRISRVQLAQEIIKNSLDKKIYYDFSEYAHTRYLKTTLEPNKWV